MILSALCALYDNLVMDPRSGVAQPNYSSVPCSYAIELSRNGEFKGIITLVENKQRVMMRVPEQAGRSGKNPPPYFLCDNAKYLLGADYDKKEKKLIAMPDRLRSAYDTYQKIIDLSEDAGLKAVIAFLKNRVDDLPLDIPADHPIYQSGNIVFRLTDEKGYIHDHPEAKEVWETYCNASSCSEERGQCLVTGLLNQPLAKTHTMLKGVADANTTGCVIVGFNFPSVTSYGKTQSYNAPVSEKAMFAYTTALNYLLSKNDRRIQIGDTTVVFWTDGKEDGKALSLISVLLGADAPKDADISDTSTEIQILDILKKVRSGQAVNDPEFKVKTYILGLAPNVARASIRFWYEDTLENFILKTGEHTENMDVVKSAKLKPRLVSIGDILRSITVKSSKKWWENVPSSYETALFRAVISGDMYPTSVYSAVLMRIRAEAGDDYGIDYIRVGYLKAYLRRYYQKQNMTEKMEELTVSLNQKSIDTAYSLGRLFAVMEALQQKANGTSTIRSRYFASASANPKLVFPTLLNLSQHHIAKIDGRYYDKQMEAILSNVTEFPAAFNLEDQGKFVLGYYHQREFIYTKKEDKELQEA
ncbi:MAG: type I-C CRISPR-associated protein Cas8c/Csd1 [Methanocorpusculum sp.]|uniref:type I-C CRISPR-associated protein Cas8c/Csd1 n=1 Tax=Methanocorpusculum sp. TaxID=2058474 RepID=UPI0027271BBF|nr:type I-C CRISPR-associated protein Cas8c/Csd1 [Methanocorpusculum sp.]MDO9522413.1 type I-C CRISPR-associated protein Cas8c/Csd1 [Methanocorpusculum sp.]